MTVYLVLKGVPDHAVQVCAAYRNEGDAQADAERRNRSSIAQHFVDAWAVL